MKDERYEMWCTLYIWLVLKIVCAQTVCLALLCIVFLWTFTHLLFFFLFSVEMYVIKQQTLTFHWILLSVQSRYAANDTFFAFVLLKWIGLATVRIRSPLPNAFFRIYRYSVFCTFLMPHSMQSNNIYYSMTFYSWSFHFESAFMLKRLFEFFLWLFAPIWKCFASSIWLLYPSTSEWRFDMFRMLHSWNCS